MVKKIIAALCLCLLIAGCKNSLVYRPEAEASNVEYKSSLDLFSQYRDELTMKINYPKILRGNMTVRRIALTFDVDKNWRNVGKIIKILNDGQARATFFVTGEMAVNHPQVIKNILIEGNAVAAMSFHFIDLTKISYLESPLEIEAAVRELRTVTGNYIGLFRPPGGIYDEKIASSVNDLGYIMVLWTDNLDPYLVPGKRRLPPSILDKINNGSIILMRADNPLTLRSLPYIIEYLKEKDYTFITIPQMLRN